MDEGEGMNNTDFSNVKVGDVVWVYNNVELASKRTAVRKVQHQMFYITGYSDPFSFSGGIHLNISGLRCFWDKVEIVAPPRPKKMVKKTVEVFVAINERDGVDTVTMIAKPHLRTVDGILTYEVEE